jgi:hypothetical protein
LFHGGTCALVANRSGLSCWLFFDGFKPLSEKCIDILPKREIDLGEMLGISSLEKYVMWVVSFHSLDDDIESFFDEEIIDALVGRAEHLELKTIEFILDFHPLIWF